MLEWVQRRHKSLEYRLLEEIGEGHKKLFHVQVFIDNEPYADAKDRSIRGAEQMASEKTLKTLTDTEKE